MEYYKQIRKAHQEYQKARNFVEDIVLSFNRELKREADKLEVVAFQVEGNSSKSDNNLKTIANVEKRIALFEEQLGAFNQTIQQALAANSQNSGNVLSGLAGLELKIKDIESSQENLRLKVTDVEGIIQKIQISPPEFKVEQPISVMPIKRDKALAALTETEIDVLELLSKEGSKTAPEIKERVQLSREHTARLMKKLYEEGYLERETGKIPFRYSVKKEMVTMLQKTENSPNPT